MLFPRLEFTKALLHLTKGRESRVWTKLSILFRNYKTEFIWNQCMRRYLGLCWIQKLAFVFVFWSANVNNIFIRKRTDLLVGMFLYVFSCEDISDNILNKSILSSIYGLQNKWWSRILPCSIFWEVNGGLDASLME